MSRCGRGHAFVIVDSPFSYFDHCLRMALPLEDEYPAQALVFVISALENFLQKAFIFESGFNLFLVKRRKVSFQNLRDAQDLYRNYFSIDLAAIGGKDWEVLAAAAKTRNSVIHNAAHDDQFRPVTVTSEYVRDIRERVERFVAALDLPLSRRGTY